MAALAARRAPTHPPCWTPSAIPRGLRFQIFATPFQKPFKGSLLKPHVSFITQTSRGFDYFPVPQITETRTEASLG